MAKIKNIKEKTEQYEILDLQQWQNELLCDELILVKEDLRILELITYLLYCFIVMILVYIVIDKKLNI